MERRIEACLALLNDSPRSETRALLSHLATEDARDAESSLRRVLSAEGDLRPVPSEIAAVRTLVQNIGLQRLEAMERALEASHATNYRVVTIWDPAYPPRLRAIPTPPWLIYVKGGRFPSEPSVAVVGTRSPTARGVEIAEALARTLASQGRSVVSGLARGVDTAAHRAALSSGGTTLAVLPSDLDHPYPPENADLARRVSEQGALVSETSPLAPMHRGRFLARNRITSGLSWAVVVVESNSDGGTVHQSRVALEQGRPLFVVDHGRFESPEARAGFETLVRMGARPISSPEELPRALEEGRKTPSPLTSPHPA